MSMLLSPAQAARFWRLFAAAWQEHALSAGLPITDRAASEAWRHDLIRHATGHASLRDVRPGEQYDALIARTAAAAGRLDIAAEAIGATARRQLDRARDCARQCAEIAGRPADPASALAYVQGTVLRAWGRPSWEDIAEPQLEQVFQMLDTHRRRLLRAVGWRGGRGPAALRYRYGTRYHHHPDGRVTANA